MSVSDRADDESRRPLIGISTYLEQAQTGVWDVRAAFLPQVYLDAVTDAGGIAVLLPPQPASPETARRVLASLDGLVLSGGADVDPALYGQVAHPRTGSPRTDRDLWELSLLSAAVETELPFLAICRGAQLLNVALGGSLHQHLPEIVGDDRYAPALPETGPVAFGPIGVRVARESRLAGIVGVTDLTVHCYHHQAIDRIAEGLHVSAFSDDGVIEAVELPRMPFGLGVQWHPEQDAADRRLFAALIASARTGVSA